MVILNTVLIGIFSIVILLLAGLIPGVGHFITIFLLSVIVIVALLR